MSTQKAIRYTVNTMRYVTLQFRDLRAADSLSQRNRVEITVLMCEQNPCPVWFGAGGKVMRYIVNIALVFLFQYFMYFFFSKYERGYSKRFMITTESWRNLHTSVYLFGSSCP